MKVQYKLIFFFVLLLCCTGEAYGQFFDDWEGRPGISVETEFENGIGVRARYRHYLDDDFSHYSGSSFGVKVDYEFKINSWFEPAVDYRYKYNGEESHHDIRYSAKLSHKMGRRFELEYSPKLQQVIASGEKPQFFVRNEIELAYNVSKPWSVFIFTENYQSLHSGFNFDTQKSGMGTEYKINDSNELEFKFDVKNKSTHEDIARLTLGYTYIIN